MTTLTRPQLIEALAAAKTNYQIANNEEDIAWDEYALSIEAGLTQDEIDVFGKLAEQRTSERLAAWQAVDTLKAQLLERDEIAVLLDAAKASRYVATDRMNNFWHSKFFAEANNFDDVPLCAAHTEAHRLAAGVFAGQIVNHL